jgi:PAS domain S-box-containing protein
MTQHSSSSDSTDTELAGARRRLSLCALPASGRVKRTSLPDDARLGPQSSEEAMAGRDGPGGRAGALFPPWLYRPLHYILALLFVAAAALVRREMGDVLGPMPFLVFYLAWVGAAAFGGLGPGLLAAAASWLCVDIFFDPPLWQVGFRDPGSIERLAVLIIGGLAVSLVSEKMRRARLGERRQARQLARVAQSLDRERQILQSVMDGARNSHLVYLDRDFNFVRVNEAYAQTCGYTPEQMIGKNHFALYPSAENAAIFARVRDTGEPFEVHDSPFVFPNQPERGTTYWDWTLTPIKNDAGDVEGLIFSLFETTQRKRAAETLRESEEKYRSIVETATEAVVIVDAQARIIFVNNRWCEVFGYSREESLRMTHFDLIFPEDMAWMRERWASRQRGRKDSYEFRLRRKDGRPVWTLVGVAPRLGPAGEFLGTLTMFADITERKRAEEALRESEARFRILTTNLSSGVALIDEDGKFALYNPAFLTMFGLTEDRSVRNVNDQNWGDWQVFEPDGTLLHLDDHPVRRAALTGQAVRNKLVGVRLPSGGALRWMLVSAEPIPGARGCRAIICTYHDVTERKAAEEALRELNATLESKVTERTKELEHRAGQLQKLTLELTEAEERERERVAQILHDDLQQIMAAAKFHLSRLSSGTRGPGATQEVVRQVDRMLMDAIEKSRDLSHELSPAVLRRGDLTETLEWLAEQMQARHGLTVRVEAVGAVQARSDAVKTLLYRSAQEMLFNVVKHARVSEARLRVCRRGRYLCLSVSDRGRGSDAQETQKTTGFGLWSIRERVALLGGRMKTRSVKGRGTTLRIVIPDAKLAPAARH